MIAGVSWIWWLGFHIVVVLLLVGDWLLPGHRRETRHAQAICLARHRVAGPGRSRLCRLDRRRRRAASPPSNLSPATPSKPRSASIICSFSWCSFRASASAPAASTRPCSGEWPERSCCAACSSSPASRLLKRFEWVTWIFGLFLLYAAFRLVRGGSAKDAIPEWIQPHAARQGLAAAGHHRRRVH